MALLQLVFRFNKKLKSEPVCSLLSTILYHVAICFWTGRKKLSYKAHAERLVCRTGGISGLLRKAKGQNKYIEYDKVAVTFDLSKCMKRKEKVSSTRQSSSPHHSPLFRDIAHHIQRIKVLLAFKYRKRFHSDAILEVAELTKNHIWDHVVIQKSVCQKQLSINNNTWKERSTKYTYQRTLLQSNILLSRRILWEVSE